MRIHWLLGLVGAVCSVGCGRVVDTPPPLRIVTDDRGARVNDERHTVVPPGVRHVRLINNGAEPHEAMFVQLPDGMSSADYVAAVAGGALFPKNAIDYSGPGLTAPGDSVDLWVPLDPGHYVLICWNKSHATELPPAEVTVRGASRDDPPPPADATITMRDFHFDIDRPISAGVRVLQIVNAGRTMHEVDLLELHDGASLADVARWREGEAANAGPAPATPRSGALDAHGLETRVWIRRTLRPGRYALYCNMPLDSTAVTGQPFRNHADVGMMRGFDVR